MKVTMPYVTWRAAGESNRKKKLGGMLGFKIEIGRFVCLFSESWGYLLLFHNGGK